VYGWDAQVGCLAAHWTLSTVWGGGMSPASWKPAALCARTVLQGSSVQSSVGKDRDYGAGGSF
jgi:hypothetical protein